MPPLLLVLSGGRHAPAPLDVEPASLYAEQVVLRIPTTKYQYELCRTGSRLASPGVLETQRRSDNTSVSQIRAPAPSAPHFRKHPPSGPGSVPCVLPSWLHSILQQSRPPLTGSL